MCVNEQGICYMCGGAYPGVPDEDEKMRETDPSDGGQKGCSSHGIASKTSVLGVAMHPKSECTLRRIL